MHIREGAGNKIRDVVIGSLFLQPLELHLDDQIRPFLPLYSRTSGVLPVS